MSPTTDVGAVAAGLLGRATKISQVAVVVHDIDRSMEQYTKLLGWGPWNVYRYEPPRLHHTVLRGERVEYTMIGAETTVGEVDFELLQPLTGPSIYSEWLERHGEGLHHIEVAVGGQEESSELKAGFAAAGAPILMAGRVGETVEFYYLDTEPLLKIVVESHTGAPTDLIPDYVHSV